MNKKLIIALDVDDVILDLVSNWIRIYNRDFNNSVRKEDVNSWDIGAIVRPEDRGAMYEYASNAEIFNTAPPVIDALEGVNLIKSYGHRVIYATANNPFGCKLPWLIKHKFLDSEDDLVTAYDKSLILADYLIDDKYDNVLAFKGKSYLFSQPWNEGLSFHNKVLNWRNIISKIKEGSMFE